MDASPRPCMSSGWRIFWIILPLIIVVFGLIGANTQ